LKQFDDRSHLIPMTREFLSLGRQAHSHYVIRLEEEKVKKKEKRKEKEENAAKALEQEKHTHQQLKL